MQQPMYGQPQMQQPMYRSSLETIREMVRTDRDRINAALSRIDLEKSVSSLPEDREKIFATVQAMEGGFRGLNMRVVGSIREWIDHTFAEPLRMGDQQIISGRSNRRSNFSIWNGVPKYDVFISYRVNSKGDAALADELYQKLEAIGIKVFLDKYCLENGVDWEVGFCNGLCYSRIFIPILSKDAINNPENVKQNFSKFQFDSPCDNLFVEHRLALELKARGLITQVFPLLIGDLLPDSNGELCYFDYFKCGCHPTAPDVVVKSVEEKVRFHLSNQRLGNPKHTMTVYQVLREITKHTGFIFEGTHEYCVNQTIEKVKTMKTKNDRSLTTLVQNAAKWLGW